MSSDEALRRYRKGQFTDHDITRCTDVSVRASREMIKIGAVRTVTEKRGRGRVRLCDATALKRTAAIGAINRAGFSLAVSGQMAYFYPLHSLLYDICDPCRVLLQNSAAADPRTGLPPRLEHPKVDWFDCDKPAKADPESDWLLEIYEGRFVGAIWDANETPTIFGDLRNEGASFVAWFPFRQRAHRMGRVIDAFVQELPPTVVDAFEEWENPTKWDKEFKLLGYKYEKHDKDDDPLCIAADAAVRSPLFKTTINVTLTIRKALRRYLGIEPAEPANR
jgi:hypothetical protein